MSNGTLRIGRFTTHDPVTTVLAHVRDSAYADYFAVDWFPPAPPIKAGHLWRANHLDAGWQIRQVRLFMSEAASDVDELLQQRPSGPVGSSERRKWFEELVGRARVK